MPQDVDLTNLIGRTPEEIVEYFEDKGYQISFRWQDVYREAHQRAFTVAGVTKMDVLESIREEVERTLREGQTFRDFQDNLEEKLRELGWWGEKEVVDPETGEVREVDLSQPHRLRTIYQTNLQTSFAKGRYDTQSSTTDALPFWKYDAVMDPATRPSHAALNGKVFRADDPIWNKLYPPNGWNCRCTVQALTRGQLQRQGLEVSDGSSIDVATHVDKEWRYNPGDTDFDPETEDRPGPMADDFRAEQSDYDPPENDDI